MAVNGFQEHYRDLWDKALKMWSKYLKLRYPILCPTQKKAEQEGLTGSFAMIRLVDHVVVIDTQKINKLKLQEYISAILAHEIGHHIYCPGDLTDQGRMIARMRRGLPTKEHLAPFIANLYSDLLINDRLKRDFKLNIDGVYRIIGKNSRDKMWTFYMRIYEILWGLTKGTLTTGSIDSLLEGDAQLGNRLIRTFARDWLKGAGRFAALCLPYLLQDNGEKMRRLYSVWTDAGDVGRGGTCPDGLADIEEDEIDSVKHPVFDDIAAETVAPEDTGARHPESGGQYREPFEYGQILKDLGLQVSEEEIRIKYYKERALPYLIPFPEKEMPQSLEPLLEGVETWSIGSPVEHINWFETVARSPYVIPGYTTVAQTYGTMAGDTPQKEPIDLDIYVDSSGSMPHPGRQVSYLALAGAIISLSALRTGARVQATLWSGAQQFKSTHGFIADEKKILGILTGYIGGSTAFPIHILRETYGQRLPTARSAHILVISDSGVTTIYDRDERGGDGFQIAGQSLEKAAAGGTFVLNIGKNWRSYDGLPEAADQGWDICPVAGWQELLDFARHFSRKKYGDKP
jgi:hypothetical protein